MHRWRRKLNQNRMYDKNCDEKMFGRKMYPASEENLVDQAAFKGMDIVLSILCLGKSFLLIFSNYRFCLVNFL